MKLTHKQNQEHFLSLCKSDSGGRLKEKRTRAPNLGTWEMLFKLVREILCKNFDYMINEKTILFLSFTQIKRSILNHTAIHYTADC